MTLFVRRVVVAVAVEDEGGHDLPLGPVTKI